MSSDDDPTPPPRAPRRTTIGDSRRRASDPAIPIAAVEEFSEPLTAPIDFWTRDLNDDDRELLAEIGIDPDRPVAGKQVLKLICRFYREARQRRRGDTDQIQRQRRLADQILDLVSKVSPDHLQRLDERLATVEKWARALQKIALALILAAAGSLGGVGALLWHRAQQEGGDAVRLQRLEEDVRRIDRRIDDAARRPVGARNTNAPVALKGIP